MTSDFEQRPRKVHLYRKNDGAVNSRGGAIDDDLCRSNHGNKNIFVTPVPEMVTCRRCLKIMDKEIRMKTRIDSRMEAPGESDRYNELLNARKIEFDTLAEKLMTSEQMLGQTRTELGHAHAKAAELRAEAIRAIEERNDAQSDLAKAHVDIRELQGEVRELNGQLRMLERLGTIPREPMPEPNAFGAYQTHPQPRTRWEVTR